MLVATTVLRAALALPQSAYPLAEKHGLIERDLNGTSNSNTPMQMRLAYAGATGMMVSWNTFSQLSSPTVRYGLSADALTRQVSVGESVTYPTSMTYNNHVRLSGLQPDTVYYYQLPNDGEVYQFKTARTPGDGTPFVAAAVVDLGLIGPDGLSNTSANALAPGEISTVDSLIGQVSEFDLLLHRKLHPVKDADSVELTSFSW